MTFDRDHVQQYLEDHVPPRHRAEIEDLAAEVGRGGVSRRSFLSRAGAMGLTTAVATTVLAACGGGGTKSASATTSATGTTTAATTGSGSGGSIAAKYKHKTVGVPVYGFSDQNQILLAYQMKAASDAAGLDWTFLIQDTQTLVASAETAVEAYITKKVDAIVPIVIPPRTIPAQLAAAKAAGIPCFGMFTSAPLWPTFVLDYGAPIPVDAALLAEYMFIDMYLRIPSGKIQLGIVDAASVDLIQPRRGVLEGQLAQAAQSRFAPVAPQNNVNPANPVQGATQAVQAILSTYPNVACIWVNYPPMAVPAAAAVQQAGKHARVYGHVGGSAGIAEIQSGSGPLAAMSYLDLTYVSWGTIDKMLAYFAGNTPPRTTFLTTDVVPTTTIDAVEAKSSNVQKVAANGQNILTWLSGAGSWRAGRVASWKQQYSS